MKKTRLIHFSTVFLVFSISIPACFDAPPWRGSVETRDGIEVLLNPGAPLLDNAEIVVSELWSHQGPTWESPTLVHVQSELVTVVDPSANRVHFHSTSGQPGASLGRSGGGPGEFLRLLDAIPLGDSMVVLDSGKGSVEVLDLSGNFRSSLHLEGQPWAGFPLPDGTLLVKGEFLSDPTQESFGDWVVIREGVDPEAFTTHHLNPLPEEQGVRCSDLYPWGEGAARIRFTKPQIHLFDEAGTLLREVWVDIPVEPVSEAERSAALEDLRQAHAERGLPPEFTQQSLVVMEERWKVKCRFGPLRFDRARRFAAFLEQNPDEFGAGNATLHFLSEDGVFLASATFQEAWQDFVMDSGVIYALTRDPDTDLITLRTFRVELPETLLTDAARVLEDLRQRGAEAG